MDPRRQGSTSARWRGVCLGVVLAGCVVYAGCAEQAAQLSAEESADLRVDMLKRLMEGLGPAEQDTIRIWIRPYSTRDSVRGATTWIGPTPTERRAIEAVFPGVRVVDYETDLYLCPPGQGVSMPGQGCPIKDEGVIVAFGSPDVAGRDTLRTNGSIIQSKGRMTWAQGYCLLYVRRSDGRWQFSAILSSWIT